MMRVLFAATLCAGLALHAAAPADAQNYPTRPIKVVVPYAAGGGADILARLVGQQLTERLKQPVVVENKGGGSNTIGMATVLLALAGGAVYLVRRNQRKAEIDEGIWHEAPAPAPASTIPTA